MTTINITSTKTSTLQTLIRQYNDATTVAAQAQAAYESYTNKAQLFQELVGNASTDLANAKAQWGQFLAVKSSLKALGQTSDDSNQVAEVTYNNIRQLVKNWETVVQTTLEAGDAINQASEFINKRKATNALVSNDLVADATTAARNAANTVTLVIQALTAALNTLTASNQAKNSTELTGAYIDMAASALLNPAEAVKVAPTTKDLQAAHEPLEQSLAAILQQASVRMASTQSALNEANMEVAASKEALDSANAKVVAAQAALSAAQAAVNA
jgi:hypothetical protein